jgi:hypothetical protein
VNEFNRGYRDGRHSESPNSGIFDAKDYVRGYILGSNARDKARIEGVKCSCGHCPEVIDESVEDLA